MRAAIGITICGLIGLTAWSCGSALSPNGSDTRAKRRTQSFDFGKARQGTVVHHTFQVANAGTEPLTISRVQTTCGCTVATVKKDAVIEPGKTLDVPVDLNVRGKKNPVESKIIVNYAGETIPDELILTGKVAEEYTESVTLPKTKRGEQPEQIVTLATYPGQPPLAIQEIKFDPAKFNVTSKPGANDGTVDIVIKPAVGAPFGSVSDKVILKTNDGETPEKQIVARVHVLKPLEAVTRQLVMRPEKMGEPMSAVAELTSTYGEPISDVTVSITRPKRFTASLEPDSPAGTVRVRVAAHPPDKLKMQHAQATLRVTAKVGDLDAEERINVIYTIEPEVPAEDIDGNRDESADHGRE